MSTRLAYLARITLYLSNTVYWGKTLVVDLTPQMQQLVCTVLCISFSTKVLVF